MSDVSELMKRCQRGVGGRNALDEAHDIMAECYGTLGRLESERDALRQQLAERDAQIERLQMQLAACVEHVYCFPDCKSAHEAEVAEQNAKFAAFEKRVREDRPDLQFKTFRGAYPYRTMTGEFTFDGAQYGGSVRDEGDGNLKWFIAQGDMADWEYLEAERAAQQGEGEKP